MDIENDKRAITEQYAKLMQKYDKETSFKNQAQAIGSSAYKGNQDYISYESRSRQGNKLVLPASQKNMRKNKRQRMATNTTFETQMCTSMTKENTDTRREHRDSVQKSSKGTVLIPHLNFEMEFDKVIEEQNDEVDALSKASSRSKNFFAKSSGNLSNHTITSSRAKRTKQKWSATQKISNLKLVGKESVNSTDNQILV